MPNEEDRLFAGYLASLLEGEDRDFAQIATRLRSSPSGRRFFDLAIDWASPQDFELALSLDRFSFCMTATVDEEGRVQIVKQDEA